MVNAQIIIDRDYRIGRIDPRLFGSFVEHMGRCVYTGIYEPGHPESDESGFRKDTAALVRELGVNILRYPGGNFVSGYKWTDGIGPKSQRPVRLDLAWDAIEINEVGIDEFADWAHLVNSQVLEAVNLGSGTPQSAGELLEYCNFSGGTYWSELRKKNGHITPMNIRAWCLGNEMDGPWQICHMDAVEYARKACEAAKLMKWTDPSIELVACGSSSPDMPTYPEWDRIVLENTYEHVDYISLHRYYSQNGSRTDYLTSFLDMDSFIKSTIASCDYVKAKVRSKKDMMLSFDEWNVSQSCKPFKEPEKWTKARPLAEGFYSTLDALAFGGLLCTLINHADRVKIACLAQLVNVLGPISTQPGGHAIRQTIFYPFMHVSHYAKGESMHSVVKCHNIKTEAHGEVPVLYTATSFDEESGMLCVFVLNLDENEDINLDFDLRSFREGRIVQHIILKSGDIDAFNSFENPDNVKPYDGELNVNTDSNLSLKLPKSSWNVIRIKVKA